MSGQAVNEDRADTAHRTFGERLRARRNGLGLSLAVLARKIGVQKSYLGQIERGEKGVRLLTILRLCEALDIDPAELFCGLLPPRGTSSRKKVGAHSVQMETNAIVVRTTRDD